MNRFKLAALAALGFVAISQSNVAKADPVGGPKRTYERVLRYDTDSYTVNFRGGEVTRISLSGDGDTCLELRVYDEFGNLIASDTRGSGDDRQVCVRPKWTGPFTVKIRNLGSVYNDYVLIMD